MSLYKGKVWTQKVCIEGSVSRGKTQGECHPQAKGHLRLREAKRELLEQSLPFRDQKEPMPLTPDFYLQNHETLNFC